MPGPRLFYAARQRAEPLRPASRPPPLMGRLFSRASPAQMAPFSNRFAGRGLDPSLQMLPLTSRLAFSFPYNPQQIHPVHRNRRCAHAGGHLQSGRMVGKFYLILPRGHVHGHQAVVHLLDRGGLTVDRGTEPVVIGHAEKHQLVRVIGGLCGKAAATPAARRAAQSAA